MTDDLNDILAELAVEDECAAANQLLLTSIRLLHRLEFIGYDEYVLTVTLAAGTEKLLKLTLGFIREDVLGKAWPSNELRGFGHDIVALHNVCRRFVDARIDGTTPHDLQQIGRRLANDPHIRGILELVSDYAKGGRFYNLDYLGGSHGDRTSVRDQWLSLIQAVNESRGEAGGFPDIALANKSRIVPSGTPGGWGSSHSLRSSVEDWRDYYITAWQFGLCGRRAQRLAENIAFLGADIP